MPTIFGKDAKERKINSLFFNRRKREYLIDRIRLRLALKTHSKTLVPLQTLHKRGLSLSLSLSSREKKLVPPLPLVTTR